MSKTWLTFAAFVFLAGCGPHYTLPNFETNEIEKVISSGRSPQGCIENLKEAARNLKDA